MQRKPDIPSKYDGAKTDWSFFVLLAVMLVLVVILVFLIRSMVLDLDRRHDAWEENVPVLETETMETVPETEPVPVVIPETMPEDILLETASDDTDSAGTLQDAPDASETAAPTEPLSVPDGVDPALVEALAVYEDYYDTYIAYEQKQAESDKPYLMLPEYTEALTKYTRAVTTVFQISQRGMNTDEQIYYDKVMDRIHRKLYEAGLRDTLS
ncbi:MAG: hypothetical protein IKI21_11495 [Oscillospiraceae bacterium]|nr:hypothetical protein [Oscillospiraceae bacterium]